MSTKIAANDPSHRSWIEVGPNSDFPIQNLPFGVFNTADQSPRCGVRIGEHVVDLLVLAEAGLIDVPSIPTKAYGMSSLNELMVGGKEGIRQLRDRISVLLRDDNDELRSNEDLRSRAIVDVNSIYMHLPVEIGDYTDFYSSREHATNVGTMFRDPNNALLPNWLHLPVVYSNQYLGTGWYCQYYCQPGSSTAS